MTPDLGKYKFVVKEGEASESGANDAPVSLACEPTESELSIVEGKGFLSIHLKSGISVHEGAEIAAKLQKWISSIGFTKING